MKIHNRSPTIKEVRKSEQCRHTFRITVAKCAPCDGYNPNCEHYEKTNYDVMFSGTEHIDSPGPAPVVGYRIAAKNWEEAVQKGKFYAEMQHPAFIPFAFAGPVIEVPKEELENLETEKK